MKLSSTLRLVLNLPPLSVPLKASLKLAGKCRRPERWGTQGTAPRCVYFCISVFVCGCVRALECMLKHIFEAKQHATVRCGVCVLVFRDKRRTQQRQATMVIFSATRSVTRNATRDATRNATRFESRLGANPHKRRTIKEKGGPTTKNKENDQERNQQENS